MSHASVVHVAVGVIFSGEGHILLARRPEHTHQGGLWEFPGGKVDPGETVADALQRELLEELAIHIEQPEPLIEVRHDYSDKSVLLDVWIVRHFAGVARGNEGQPIAWVKPSELQGYPFPEANQPIVSALQALACAKP